VRIAICRYVLPRIIPDVSEARERALLALLTMATAYYGHYLLWRIIPDVSEARELS
jgi:hypothetical protein